jgi:hypothetical protein
MIPSTVRRVPLHTIGSVNEQIRKRTEENVARVAARGPEAIDERLGELDREWDIDRAVEAKLASVILIGSALGVFRDRRFFAIPAIASTFLLLYAVQGWCPPLPILRRAGFRTSAEIDHERYALKALRGDFKTNGAPTGERLRATLALEAAEA